MLKIKINQTALSQLRLALANQLAEVVETAADTARSLAPVDTSSLQESIRSGVQISGSDITGQVAAGGEDFSGTFFASTGQFGNYVDYAADQEAIHGYMETAAGEITRRLMRH